MKVKHLIEILQAQDENAEVVIQKDSEGNGYSPCSGAEPGMYTPDSTWSGYFKDKEEFDDERKWAPDSGFEPDDEEYEENAVVLYPIN